MAHQRGRFRSIPPLPELNGLPTGIIQEVANLGGVEVLYKIGGNTKGQPPVILEYREDGGCGPEDMPVEPSSPEKVDYAASKVERITDKMRKGYELYIAKNDA